MKHGPGAKGWPIRPKYHIMILEDISTIRDVHHDRMVYPPQKTGKIKPNLTSHLFISCEENSYFKIGLHIYIKCFLLNYTIKKKKSVKVNFILLKTQEQTTDQSSSLINFAIMILAIFQKSILQHHNTDILSSPSWRSINWRDSCINNSLKTFGSLTPSLHFLFLLFGRNL